MKRITALVLLGMTLVIGLGPAYAQGAKRELIKLKGDVYRFRNNHHYSIVVFSSEGVLVTDPINHDAARWLRTEIGKLAKHPITHLVYSHSHPDHASGGQAFGDGLTVIAHQNAPVEIDGVKPTVRFDKTHKLTLGDKQIELTALGPGHGTDLIAMIVRPENVLFVVDAVAASRLPYRDFPGVNIDGLINQIKTVEGLQFELMAPGHGATGTMADVKAQREYVELLRQRVTDALAKGIRDDELADAVPMTEYKGWGAYEAWHRLNVSGMAAWLRK